MAATTTPATPTTPAVPATPPANPVVDITTMHTRKGVQTLLTVVPQRKNGEPVQAGATGTLDVDGGTAIDPATGRQVTNLAITVNSAGVAQVTLVIPGKRAEVEITFGACVEQVRVPGYRANSPWVDPAVGNRLTPKRPYRARAIDSMREHGNGQRFPAGTPTKRLPKEGRRWDLIILPTGAVFALLLVYGVVLNPPIVPYVLFGAAWVLFSALRPYSNGTIWAWLGRTVAASDDVRWLHWMALTPLVAAMAIAATLGLRETPSGPTTFDTALAEVAKQLPAPPPTIPVAPSATPVVAADNYNLLGQQLTRWFSEQHAETVAQRQAALAAATAAKPPPPPLNQQTWKDQAWAYAMYPMLGHRGPAYYWAVFWAVILAGVVAFVPTFWGNFREILDERSQRKDQVASEQRVQVAGRGSRPKEDGEGFDWKSHGLKVSAVAIAVESIIDYLPHIAKRIFGRADETNQNR